MRSLIYNEHCSKCNCGITFNESDYSINHFQLPLCFKCQDWYKGLKNKPTPHAKKLFLSLREKGLRLKLEHNDSSKTIDISSEDAMMHIEVDGIHHTTEAEQAANDLWRTYYSIKEGYYTLRVPNLLIKKDFNQTLKVVYNILLERKKQKQSEIVSPNYSFQERLISAFVKNMKV